MGAADHIAKLRKTVDEAQRELAKIGRLREEFPDLETHTDRWGTVRYMAASANPRVTEVEFRRSCGCCSDTPLLAMPFLEHEGTRVYSDPFHVFVGHHTYDGDVIAEEGWKKEIQGGRRPVVRRQGDPAVSRRQATRRGRRGC